MGEVYYSKQERKHAQSLWQVH